MQKSRGSPKQGHSWECLGFRVPIHMGYVPRNLIKGLGCKASQNINDDINTQIQSCKTHNHLQRRQHTSAPKDCTAINPEPEIPGDFSYPNPRYYRPSNCDMTTRCPRLRA